MLQHEAPQNEPRYDAETLRKVTALAHELKERQQETLSAREIETIGEEVGLERRFMQEALAQVVSPRIVTPPTATSEAIRLHRLKAFMAAWWAAGWTLPLIMMGSRIEDGSFAPFLFFLGWAVYLGGGILLTMLSRPPTELDGQASSENLSQRAARASPAIRWCAS